MMIEFFKLKILYIQCLQICALKRLSLPIFFSFFLSNSVAYLFLTANSTLQGLHNHRAMWYSKRFNELVTADRGCTVLTFPGLQHVLQAVKTGLQHENYVTMASCVIWSIMSYVAAFRNSHGKSSLQWYLCLWCLTCMICI